MKICHITHYLFCLVSLSVIILLISIPVIQSPSWAKDTDRELIEIVEKYPGYEKEIRHAYNEYYMNFFEMEEKYGINGVLLLNAIGLNAITLDMSYPLLLRIILNAAGPDSVGPVLHCWGPFLKSEMKGGLSHRVRQWLDTISRLEKWQMKILAKHPKTLPAVAVAPYEVCRFLENKNVEFDSYFIYLDYFNDPRRNVLNLIRALEKGGRYLEDFLRLADFQGLLLYGAHLDLTDELVQLYGLELTYAIIQTNAEDLTRLYEHYRPSEIAAALRPYFTDLPVKTSLVSSGFAIRLLVEFGSKGAECFQATGGRGADLIYQAYSETKRLRKSVLNILIKTKISGFDALYRYQDNQKFRRILLEPYATQAVIKIERADQLAKFRSIILPQMSKEERGRLSNRILDFVGTWMDTGEGEIDMIMERGGDYLEDTMSPVELAPGYDVYHVFRVLFSGGLPTAGEWAWATVDATFLVLDVVEIAGAVILVVVTPGVPDELALLLALAAQNSARMAAKVGIKKGFKGLSEEATQKIAKEVFEELIDMLRKNQLKSIDDIAKEATKLTAKKAKKMGITITEDEIGMEAKALAKALPQKAFWYALKMFSGRGFGKKGGTKLLRFAIEEMPMENLRKICGPNLKALSISLMRSGPRKIGQKTISWYELIPEGVIKSRILWEMSQTGVSYVVMSHMGDVLDWLIQMEEQRYEKREKIY